MDDADAGWHHAESLERLLAPLEELVTLAVALEFEIEIELQGLGGAEEIHLHGVVDHEVHGDERLDHLRIAAEPGDGGAHGARSTSKGTPVKSCNTTRATTKGISTCSGFLAFQLARVLTSCSETFFPVAIAQDRLEDNADGDGEPRDRPHPLFFQSGQRIEAALFP